MSTITEGSSTINKPSYEISPVIWPNDTNTTSLDDDENEDSGVHVDNFNDEDEDVEEEITLHLYRFKHHMALTPQLFFLTLKMKYHLSIILWY